MVLYKPITFHDPQKVAARYAVVLASMPYTCLSGDPMATDAPASTPEIRRLHGVELAQLHALAEVLVDCVEGGASVSFMLPMTPEKSLAFWRKVADGVTRGERILLVAEDAQGIVGTVQVILDQPENQPHRADVAKMLVHRRARRQGAGEALMRAAEAAAREAGKTLLVLDTGDATAARLYERLGWQAAGRIPRYALMPAGGDCDTTFYYRDLRD